MTEKVRKKYDLEERTAKFGSDVIMFCKKITRNEITRPLINQLIKCGMLVVAEPDLKEPARTLWTEAKELNLIFNSIYKKVR